MKITYLKNRQIFLLALLIIGFGACKKDDFLNVPPKGSLTDAATFSSEGNADLFVNDIYDQEPNMNNEDEVLDQYTDNGFCGAVNMVGQRIIRAGVLNPGNSPNGSGNLFNWSQNYTSIRKCNVFLQEAAKNQANFSAAWYTERVAEVKFLRALYYSFLYQNFGGVPLISVPLNNQTQGDSIFVARSTLDQTLAFIIADCDAAAADLPLHPQDLGRATKGAAMTLKAALQLFAASPLVNTSNDAQKWATAAASNMAVRNLGVYSLFQDNGNGYATQFLKGNNFNSEQIFCRAYATPSKGHRREGLVGPVIVHGGEQAWGNLSPTQNLVDDYEMDNGLPISDPASGYDPQNPYLNREKRFYQDIVYDNCMWQGDTWQSRIGGNNQIDLGSTSDISNTGYNGRKTLDESIPGNISFSGVGTSNYTWYRYAEVLLNYAEAQNEAVGPDASVYGAIDSIRTRSSLPGLPAGLTQDQMRVDIRRERRIELSFEDKRWYDIRRWDITTKGLAANGEAVLVSPDYGMKITVGAGNVLTYTPIIIFTNQFSEWQNWLPIPQGVVEQNPKLQQNPGY